MGASVEQYMHEVMSGRARGMRARVLRAALRAAEGPYAAGMALRNRLFDSGGRRVHRLAAPVISVGNITAGGTGKTPVVRWLATRMREAGFRPAVLMRGYKHGAEQSGDEQMMLEGYLGALEVGGETSPPQVLIRANPNRVEGGHDILREHPETNLIILDDGFQHRRLWRDFDLVLIDAANPFGYGHVHPRGLLREPLAGLKRADAFVLTRCDDVEEPALRELSEVLRSYSPRAPVYRARHEHVGLRSANVALAEAPDIPVTVLREKRFFAFAGIANPMSLERQLAAFTGYAGHHWFGDHHHYTREDLARMGALARQAGAEVMVVTEKDWVKLGGQDVDESSPPILRLELEVRFSAEGEEGLLNLIQARLDAGEVVSD